MNNRQNGRRRGRGGQQVRNGQPGGPSTGNRLDNRARGNAAQLLEKYKALARDAQTQSDRVNTEYYLQFADHYFRILNENRVRFEEQRRGPDGGEGDDQQGYQSRDDNGDDNWDDDGDTIPEYRQPDRAPERQPERQAERQPDRQPERQPDRQPRPRRDDRPQQQPPQQQAEAPAEAPRAPRERRPYVNREQPAVAKSYAAPETVNEDSAPARIEIDLPPSISGGDVSVDNDGEAAPKRRRTRRPRAETSAVEA